MLLHEWLVVAKDEWRPSNKADKPQHTARVVVAPDTSSATHLCGLNPNHIIRVERLN